jgi:D-beta-D-heptose 7-phosphate kinase / D-beta-D-heptose 1-phosphate adenosyltransferase
MNPSAVKILSREQLPAVMEDHRRNGKRIVFTNGCFDLLHVGHARYLETARGLGDLLVVGVNSDTSVRGLKGEKRPLVPQDERAELLAHLGCVDYVTVFDEERPDAVIALVQPAIHVKGGDYAPETLPEAETVRRYGGRIEIVPLVLGRSTTNVIERVREVYCNE